MLHINDVALLYSFLGSSYSYYPICPASDLQGIDLETCRYSSLTCFNLFYDSSSCEMRFANVGGIESSPREDAVLVLEQRAIDLKFWKRELEQKWFYEVERKKWVYVLLVDFNKGFFKKRRTSYDLASLIVFCCEENRTIFESIRDEPCFLYTAQESLDEYTNCQYSVDDFDSDSETIPFNGDKTVPGSQLKHWHFSDHTSILITPPSEKK